MIHVVTSFKTHSRTWPFQTRLIRSPRYFEGRSNAVGFTLPVYSSPVISKPRYFELFSISLGSSKQRGSTVIIFPCNHQYHQDYQKKVIFIPVELHEKRLYSNIFFPYIPLHTYCLLHNISIIYAFKPS